jgi:hypothetical protein
MYCHPLLPFMGVNSSVYKDRKKKEENQKISLHCQPALITVLVENIAWNCSGT